MRNVPKKNYFLLILLFAVTAFIVFFACNIYKSRTEKQYISVMDTFITEVKLDDLNGYTLENSQVVIFVSNKSDYSLKDVEEDYKKIITDYNLQHLFVYLNVSAAETLDSFNEMYNVSLTNNNLPILVVIDEGKVVDSYVEAEYSKANIISFLEKNEVIESD